jgi:CBS domain-containing protein
MHARITTLVRDVMTRRTLTIEPEASLAAAIAVMRDNEIRHLPVVDNMGRLAGIITDRDLRSAALAPGLSEFLPADLKRAVEAAADVLQELRVKDVRM